MTRHWSVPNSVSTLALVVALAAGPSPAAAQSFQGSGSFTNGAGSINTTTGPSPGDNTTTVTVDTAQSVIDWDASDDAVGNFGAINFQPAGTTATFQNNPDLIGNFAVLNRINIADQTRIVALNGLIQSQVNGQTGGSIFFYSPSGFVLTATSVINVGSLVLSASPITVDGNGNFINGGTVQFGPAPNPNAAINVVSDVIGTAQINASGTGSYVALVAPTILHQGDIRTDGAAALVAAEAATITFSPDGLFDITVTTGTDAGTGIHVDGGTIGRNSSTVSPGNVHRAYLVAVAKNDAVTMLINNGASVGFEIGSSATVEDNAVVISGGYNIEDGDHQALAGVSNVPLTITNANLSSHVDAQVTGGAAINSSQGALTFGGSLDIIGGATTAAGGNVLIDGQNGNALTIGGDLYARSYRLSADGTETGLITRLGATGGSTVTIGGDVHLDSDSFGASAQDFDENGTSVTGGNAQVNIGASSTLNVTGSIFVHADGYGGSSFNATAGNGIGGQALVMSIGGNATVTVGGSVTANAVGYGGGVGGDCQSGCGVTGGAGIGGSNVSVHTNVGSGNVMEIGGDVSVNASGFGGDGDVVAGVGRGGTANLGAADNSTLTVGGDTEVYADGLGGYGYDSTDGGLGRGGTARVGTNSGGSIELTGPVFVTANGEGGNGADGGVGTGGFANISAFRGDVHAFNSVLVSANSDGGSAIVDGGSGGAGLADIETAVTPAMTEASLSASGGMLTIDGLATVSGNATGGDGGANGGRGGDAVAAGIAGSVLGGAIVHAANSDDGPSVIRLANVVVSADAQGGQGGDGQGGGSGGPGGDGGSATGGKAIVTAAAGSGDLVMTGATLISASATGGDGGNGGNGDGGNGGDGGAGGSATGGFINVGSESGNPNFAQGANNGTATYTTIVALATATGGNGGDGGFGEVAGLAGDGGDAEGGNSVLLVRGSTVNVDTVNLDASAFGGDGGLNPDESFGGNGGDAITGTVGVLATNRFQLPDQRGTLNAGSITGTAIATGGNGLVSGGEWTAGGGALFEFVNSEGLIGSVNLAVAAADGLDPNAAETFASRVAVVESTVNVTGAFAIQTPGRISVHVDDPDPDVVAMTADTFSISADNFVHDETRVFPPDVGTISANSISLTTGQDLIVDAHLDSVNGVGFTAPGLIDLENVESNGPLSLTAGTTVDSGNLAAGTLVAVNGGGSINVGNILAGTQQALVQTTAGNITTGTISAGTFAGLNGPGDVTTGNVDAAGDIQVTAGGSITTGNATSTGGSIFMDAGDAITTGNLAALNFVELDAFGDIDFGNVNADDFDAETDGDVTGGDIVAGTFAGVETFGSITLGDIAVGTVRTGGPSEDGFAVGLVSATSITTGDVEADESIGFATLGNLTTGYLDAGFGVMALVGGNMNLGSITTPSNGLVYLADASMFTDAGGPDEFDPLQVLAQDPVPTGGLITINGPVTTGTFQAAAGTSLTTGAIDASSIYAISGGLLSINGLWSAEEVEATSADIAIAATGGIDAGNTGTITLVSSNTNGAFIGDGLTGTGYNLSNAEFGRLQSGNLRIAAGVGPDAAGQMTIGDLDITGPLVGSTIDDPSGSVIFATLNEAGTGPDGQIRIVGDVKATGFGPDNVLEFFTERFNLDADTGSIRIEGTGGALGGILDITADRIHVASGAVLDKLDDDPLYEGREADLAAPLATPRPGGVIAADTIWVSPTQAVLVQNTGTTSLRAGFLAREVELFAPEGAAPGSIELIVNGQGLVDGVTYTGVEVRDALVEDTDLSIYSDNSSINGCPLTGACVNIGGPPVVTPLPGIPDEIRLIDRGELPPPEFGNEDFIDDNDEENDDAMTSPIKPPQPLFDTSALADGTITEDSSTGARPLIGTPMRSNPGLERKGDVDDPVSGSGNPSLIDTPANPTK